MNGEIMDDFFKILFIIEEEDFISEILDEELKLQFFNFSEDFINFVLLVVEFLKFFEVDVLDKILCIFDLEMLMDEGIFDVKGYMEEKLFLFLRKKVYFGSLDNVVIMLYEE